MSEPATSNGPSTAVRVTTYVLANLAFMTLLAMCSISGGGPTGTLIYVTVLFALCTSPLLVLDGFNGRYALSGIFLGIYFVFFGALDTITFIKGDPFPHNFDTPTMGEWALLCGAAMMVIGYRCGLALSGSVRQPLSISDWSQRTALIFGAVIWLCGTASIVYFQVFAIPEKTDAAARHGFAALGPVWTFALMLGQMMEPLGLVVLAYAYAREKTFKWLALVLSMVLAQIAVGFIADIKSLAMLAGILVILARTLVDNKLPKGWLLGGALFIVFAFPLFQAYRATVSGERGWNHAQALENIDKVMEMVLANRDKVMEGGAGRQRTQTFFERSSIKANVELTVEHAGADIPFQDGGTLIGLIGSFIPRLLWPDKPDVPTGQLFNHTFMHSDDDTYISPSHFGELYWNFGWPGIVFGMLFIGTLLGFIAARCSLASGQSVTRMLVFLTTVRYICLGFEGSISVAYVTWLRSLAVIGLLHLLLARKYSPQQSAVASATPAAPDAPAQGVPLYPNLMR
jgi:hypothetical protein